MNIQDFEEKYRQALSEIYLESRQRYFTWLDQSKFRHSDFSSDTNDERIWVACLQDKPLGFISVWMPENFIHHLYVHPDHTNKGIGGALLEHCKQQVNKPLWLKCMKQNVAAMAFYKKRGWLIESDGQNEQTDYYLMKWDKVN
ncbi:GNAT family N-acetyltransferase [Kaarinaea lacus]